MKKKKKQYNDTEEWFGLIPQLKDWNDNRGINHEGWIEIEGKIEYALAYSSIFWPEFTLFKDCIFIHEMNDEVFDTWYKNTEGNLKSLEATINHRHLDMWFTGECDKNQLDYFSSVLKDMWETKLSKQFPDRKVIVDLKSETEDYIITIYQENH